MKTRLACSLVLLVTSALLLVACGSGSKKTPPPADTSPPVITLTGDDPQILIAGNPYVELSANATDDVDGNLTASIVIDASGVDAATPGDYTVTYDVSDAAGNAAVTVTRAVTVLASPPAPNIQLTHNRMPFTTPGTTVQLSWTSPDALTCDASGGWSGPRITVGLEDIGELWESTTFSLTCTAGGDATTVSTRVLVGWQPQAGIGATPSSVLSGSPTTITWGSIYADSCSASGDWNEPIGISGTFTTGPLTAASAFSVNCSGDGGTASASTAIVLTTFPVASVSLDVRPDTIEVGQSAQAVTTVRDSGGSPLRDRLITRTSDDPTVATISADGRAIGRMPGVTQLATESEGQSAQFDLTVIAPGPDDRQQRIDSMYAQLASRISSAITYNEAGLPGNPRNRDAYLELLALLRSPTLESEIRDNNYVEASIVESIDGRRLPIVTMFPRASSREDAIRANGYVQLATPLLENFLQVPFPYSGITSWYGFYIGNRGGGGAIFSEDQATYEKRRGPVILGYLPFEAIIHHEVSHSYFGNENLTQFLELYVYNRVYTNSLVVDSWVYTRDYEPFLDSNSRTHGLLDIYQLIGHDAMARAYQTLYPLRPPYGAFLSEAGKQAFVNEAPPALQDQVREILDRGI
jgi:hypothetical protein